MEESQDAYDALKSRVHALEKTQPVSSPDETFAECEHHFVVSGCHYSDGQIRASSVSCQKCNRIFPMEPCIITEGPPGLECDITTAWLEQCGLVKTPLLIGDRAEYRYILSECGLDLIFYMPQDYWYWLACCGGTQLNVRTRRELFLFCKLMKIKLDAVS